MSVEKYFSVKPWPHQFHGVEQCVNRIGKGNRICVCSPTGGGKSKMMEALVRYGVDNGMKVDLKVCRKMLRDQLMDVFTRAGVKFGVRAAGMGHLYDPSQPVQICSTPTENSRILRDDPTWKTTGADLILVDEAHMQVGPSFVKLLNKQCEEGACVVGFTATPIGISQYYNDLIVAGTNSELRACKSHVRAIVKAPFEFDLHKIGRNAIGEYDNGQVAKKVYSTSVVGKIMDTWIANNPDQKPTICFAPDVASSIWLASSFVERGIHAAHIDAKQVWFDGELKNDPSGELRTKILKLYTEGEIKILTNRFVLREGLDCLDDKTEVLTEHGWADIDSHLSDTDKVWTLNLNTGNAELKPVEGKVSRWRRPDERMVVMKGQHNDIRVTEGHRFHLKYFDPEMKSRWGNTGRFSKNFIVRHARDLVGRKSNFGMPVSAVAEFEGLPLTNEELMLIGWVVSDGGISSHPNDKLLHIYQKKTQYLPTIRKLLEACSLPYDEKINKSNGCHTFSVKWTYWEKLSPYISKDGKDEWNQMTVKQFCKMWNAMVMGDGHVPTKGQGGKNPTICVGSKKLVDRLCAMALLRGYACNVLETKSSTSGNPVWYIRKSKKLFRSHRQSDDRATQVVFEEGFKPERVWCITNENDTLFIRRNGKCCIVGNCPATYNVILATPFGSLKTYLQAVGRGIRYSAETSDHVLITDHGGNYHRHGSPNLDRDWESIFWMTEEELFKEEKERKEKIERDDLPITCPKCGTVRASGNRCPEPPIGCGFESDFRGRVIIQREGKLKIMKEDAILGVSKPKVKTAQELWDSMFWALRNSKSDKPKNFKQMRVLFHAKHGYWAPYGLKRMPRFKHNEATSVRDIKFEDLI